MKHKKRKRVFADLKIQGGLCLRIAIYWFTCHFVTVGTIFGFACLEGPTTSSGSISRFFVPAMVAATLVLPLVLLDVLVFSNRFTGPILNFRRRFKALADGESTEPIRFRPADYLKDIGDNYNKVRERLLQNSNAENLKSFDESKIPVSGGV